MIFLPVVFLLYWFVFKRLRWQNLLILVASYVFYGWWDWRFLILIVITSLSSYASGLLIQRFEGRRRWQRLVSICNIVLNLGILATFKYFNFFATSLQVLLSSIGIAADWPTLNIILPVGISFYTFQALSYSIDVYARRIEPTRDAVAFFSFISFFPQLVAGPIERATSLLPQILAPRRFDYSQAVDGLRQMLWGFFKKLIIADGCAEVVNQTWNGLGSATGMMLMVCSLLFTFQIYADFSGYSDIAIGCAKLFGIKLTTNFRVP
ncbi:MAG: MBOAT family protein, partial [Muribaculaceae bacterium]|nr:MBOAT family protein [Muribaculaceae bacterium]